MKTKFIPTSLLVIIILFGASFIYNFAYANNSACTDKKEQVALKGDLRKPGIKSGGDPFEVFKDPYFLSIYYLQDLSNISIEILDEFEQVIYSNRVNPSSGGSLYIDISNWPTGYYTLYFEDEFGNSMCGCFEVQ